MNKGGEAKLHECRYGGDFLRGGRGTANKSCKKVGVVLKRGWVREGDEASVAAIYRERRYIAIKCLYRERRYIAINL